MSPNQASAEALAEAFSYLTHEREDVQKMAVHGIAEQSKDNAELCQFLVTKPVGPRQLDVLLQHLHIGSVKILGDILSILINISLDAQCAELLVEKKVIRKAMRLLDSLQSEHVESSPALALSARGLQELSLMLLNNLTASYVIAVDEVLQKEDEDMRGFYLGKLQLLYDRCGIIEGEGEEAALDQRDLRRWVLRIVLNLSRCVDGQEQLLSDENWCMSLRRCLLGHEKPNTPTHRLLASQVLRNCACSSTRESHTLLLKTDFLVTAVHRLSSPSELEEVAEIQQCLAEFIAAMLESEDGVERLESINAKKLLSAMVSHTKKHHESLETNEEARVVEIKDGEEGEPVEVPHIIDLKVAEFVERHIVVHLDDIIDAYLAPGSDEID